MISPNSLADRSKIPIYKIDSKVNSQTILQVNFKNKLKNPLKVVMG